MGVPFSTLTTIWRTSSSVFIRPSDRTSSASSPSLMRPAPSLRLLAANASPNNRGLTPRAAIRCGSGITSKLRTYPPSEFTSATPGTVRNAGRITQSSIVRRSVRLISPSTVNMNISPSGVVIGAMPPSMSVGRLPHAALSRSATCWRAQ